MLYTIEEAIEDIKAGKIVIVVDDEDRENEGDFLAAANKVTPEMINFIATHGRGLICAPLIEDRCEELELELMVGKNTRINPLAPLPVILLNLAALGLLLYGSKKGTV